MPLSKPNGTLTGWKGICYVQDMNKPVVEVRGLSKQYRLGATVSHDTLRDAITDGFKSIFGRNSETPRQSDDETIWALKDVSFDVKEGEVLGIIGRNGAGKSTLLKVLSRITEPTEGEVKIKGRVGSLLEVGTGFHPELTGRENIYLNGAILGMKKEEIKKKFDEMVAFAEIEKFLDTPVKRYSSGMYVRLAFAVAAHFEPEILIVDEVLAVGDAQFQKRCLGKMGDVAKGGRTVLFVSHNMGAVKALCQRALLLHEGCVVEDGETEQVIGTYLYHDISESETKGQVIWEDESTAPGGVEIKLLAVRLLSRDGKITDTFSEDADIHVEIFYKIIKPLKGMCIIFNLLTQEGEVVFVSTDYNYQPENMLPGLYKSVCNIPGGLLNTKTYILKIGGGIPRVKFTIPLQECLTFIVKGVKSQDFYSIKQWPGAIRPKLKWQVSEAKEYRNR
jgi:lipopolysaccharide transport system ATP-binding protein